MPALPFAMPDNAGMIQPVEVEWTIVGHEIAIATLDSVPFRSRVHRAIPPECTDCSMKLGIASTSVPKKEIHRPTNCEILVRVGPNAMF